MGRADKHAKEVCNFCAHGCGRDLADCSVAKSISRPTLSVSSVARRSTELETRPHFGNQIQSMIINGGLLNEPHRSLKTSIDRRRESDGWQKLQCSTEFNFLTLSSSRRSVLRGPLTSSTNTPHPPRSSLLWMNHPVEHDIILQRTKVLSLCLFSIHLEKTRVHHHTSRPLKITVPWGISDRWIRKR